MKCLGLLVFVVFTQSLDAFTLSNRNNFECKTCGSSGNSGGHSQNIPNFNSFKSTSNQIQQANKLFWEQNKNKRSGKQCPDISTDGLNESLKGSVGILLSSFSDLYAFLDGLTSCASQILSTVSVDLIAIIDPLTNLSGSVSSIYASITETIPDTFTAFCAILSKLQIGSIDSTLADLVKRVEVALLDVVSSNGNIMITQAKKLEAFTALGSSIQVLLNTVSVVFTTITQITVSTEVQEAVSCIAFILDVILAVSEVVIIGITSKAAPALTTVTYTLLATINTALSGLTSAITSIKLQTSSITVSITVFVRSITVLINEVTDQLNNALKGILGVFKGITCTVGQITSSLTGVVSGITGSLGSLGGGKGNNGNNANLGTKTNSATAIISAITSVSKLNSHVISSVTQQLTSALNRTPTIIAYDKASLTNLTGSLTVVFASLCSAVEELVQGLGDGVVSALLGSINDIQSILNKIFSVLSIGASEAININGLVSQIAKAVQILCAIVTSITETVSQSTVLSSVVYESVFALFCIDSTVLHTVEVLLDSVSSTFISITGNACTNLSKVTELIASTALSFTNIISKINVSDNIKQTLISVAPTVTQTGRDIISSFTEISNTSISITFSLEQITSNSRDTPKPGRDQHGVCGTTDEETTIELETSETSQPCEKPESLPESCEESESLPESCEEPVNVAASCEESESESACDENESLPESCEESESLPESCEEPVNVPASCEEPGSLPESCEEPDSLPESCEESESLPESCEEPVNVPASCEEPESAPASCEEPDSLPESCEESESLPESCEEPVNVPESCEEPESESASCEETSTDTEHSHCACGLSDDGHGFRWNLDWILKNNDLILKNFSGSLSFVASTINVIVQRVSGISGSVDVIVENLTDVNDACYEDILSSCLKIKYIEGLTGTVAEYIQRVQLSEQTLTSYVSENNIDNNFKKNLQKILGEYCLNVQILVATVSSVVDCFSKDGSNFDDNIRESILALLYTSSNVLLIDQASLYCIFSLVTSKYGIISELQAVVFAINRAFEQVQVLNSLISSCSPSTITVTFGKIASIVYDWNSSLQKSFSTVSLSEPSVTVDISQVVTDTTSESVTDTVIYDDFETDPCYSETDPIDTDLPSILEDILSISYENVQGVQIQNSVNVLTSSINYVLNCNSPVLASTVNELVSVFTIISSTTGSTDEIKLKLTDTVGCIFDIFDDILDNFSNYLCSDIIDTLKNAVDEVEADLITFISLSNGADPSTCSSSLETVVQQIDSKLQNLIGIIFEITTTVDISIDSNIIGVVISLYYVVSSVYYSVTFVIIVASDELILTTVINNVVTISSTLSLLTDITKTISESITGGVNVNNILVTVTTLVNKSKRNLTKTTYTAGKPALTIDKLVRTGGFKPVFGGKRNQPISFRPGKYNPGRFRSGIFRPGSFRPGKGQPVIIQPIISRPGRNQPVRIQRGRTQPVRIQQVRSQTGRNQPEINLPVKNQLGKNKPVRNQPVRNQHVRNQPERIHTLRNQPEIHKPARHQTVIKQPVRHQPKTESEYCEGPLSELESSASFEELEAVAETCDEITKVAPIAEHPVPCEELVNPVEYVGPIIDIPIYELPCEEPESESACEESESLPESCEEPVNVPASCEEPGSLPESCEEPDSLPESCEESESLPESCEEPVNAPASCEEPESAPGSCEEPESAPASCEEPDSLPESCEESESLPESCEEPVNVPASCEEPGSLPESCEEPDSLPESCEESESLPESCEEPVNVPASCEEPESAPASCEEPDSLPESCEESESLPESCEEPVNVPASCEEPESTPASCEEPDSLPESCEESESLPESCEEPVNVPASCEEPESAPASCEEPDSLPESCEESESLPESCEEPVNVPASCEEPGSLPESCEEPDSLPESCEESESLPESCEEPVNVPASCEEPESAPASCEEPVSLPESCEESESLPESCEEPVNVPESCEEPENESASCEETSTDTEHSHCACGLSDDGHGFRWNLDWILKNNDLILKNFSGSLSFVASTINVIVQRVSGISGSVDVIVENLTDVNDACYEDILSSCLKIKYIEGLTGTVAEYIQRVQLSEQTLTSYVSENNIDNNFKKNLQKILGEYCLNVQILVATVSSVVDCFSKDGSNFDDNIRESILALLYTSSNVLLIDQASLYCIFSLVTSKYGIISELQTVVFAINRAFEQVQVLNSLISSCNPSTITVTFGKIASIVYDWNSSLQKSFSTVSLSEPSVTVDISQVVTDTTSESVTDTVIYDDFETDPCYSETDPIDTDLPSILEDILSISYENVQGVQIQNSVNVLTSSINYVLNCNSPVLASTVNELVSVFTIISSTTGSTDEIKLKLTDTVGCIFDIFDDILDNFSNYLCSDIIDTLKNAVDEVEADLITFISLSNGADPSTCSSSLETVVQQIDSKLQNLIGIIFEITTTVDISIDSNIIGVVISLYYVVSSVYYSVTFVIIVASDELILTTVINNVVTISSTLSLLTDITKTISESITGGVNVNNILVTVTTLVNKSKRNLTKTTYTAGKPALTIDKLVRTGGFKPVFGGKRNQPISFRPGKYNPGRFRSGIFRPGSFRPGKGQPVIIQPIISRPGRNQPVRIQRGRTQPVRIQQVRSQTGRNQPEINLPVKNQLGKNKPVRNQPVRNQHVRNQPERIHTLRNQPEIHKPARHQTVIKQPVRHQPKTESEYCEGPSSELESSASFEELEAVAETCDEITKVAPIAEHPVPCEELVNPVEYVGPIIDIPIYELPCEEPESESACEESESLPESCEEPVNAPASCEEPESAPGSCEEPESLPESCEESESLPESCEEPVNVPASCEEPESAPASCEEPDSLPESCEESESLPESCEEPVNVPASCEEPVNVPASCEEPESAPASCEEPDSLPESCEESESLPESCEEPVNVPASCEEPESTPASCEEPDSLPESCEESESLPESCEEPVNVPASCEEPESAPASCEEPDSLPESCEESESLPESCEEPVNVPESCEEPESESASCEETSTDTEHSHCACGLSDDGHGFRWNLDWILKNNDLILKNFSGSLSFVASTINVIVQRVSGISGSVDVIVENLTDVNDACYEDILSSCLKIKYIEGLTGTVAEYIQRVQLSEQTLTSYVSENNIDNNFKKNLQKILGEYCLNVQILVATVSSVVDCFSKDGSNFDDNIRESILALLYTSSNVLLIDQASLYCIFSLVTSKYGIISELQTVVFAINRAFEQVQVLNSLISSCSPSTITVTFGKIASIVYDWNSSLQKSFSTVSLSEPSVTVDISQVVTDTTSESVTDTVIYDDFETDPCYSETDPIDTDLPSILEDILSISYENVQGVQIQNSVNVLTSSINYVLNCNSPVLASTVNELVSVFTIISSTTGSTDEIKLKLTDTVGCIFDIFDDILDNFSNYLCSDIIDTLKNAVDEVEADLITFISLSNGADPSTCSSSLETVVQQIDSKLQNLIGIIFEITTTVDISIDSNIIGVVISLYYVVSSVYYSVTFVIIVASDELILTTVINNVVTISSTLSLLTDITKTISESITGGVNVNNILVTVTTLVNKSKRNLTKTTYTAGKPALTIDKLVRTGGFKPVFGGKRNQPISFRPGKYNPGRFRSGIFRPGSFRPGKGQPVIIQPIISRPGRNQPVRIQRGRTQPVRIQQVRSQTGRNQPEINLPVKNQLGKNKPVRNQPVRNQHVRNQPERIHTLRNQPEIHKPARHQTVIKQPVRHQPKTESEYCEGPSSELESSASFEELEAVAETCDEITKVAPIAEHPVPCEELVNPVEYVGPIIDIPIYELPCEEPESESACEESESLPESCEEPVNAPASCEEPESAPGSCEEPESAPASCEEPGSLPESCEESESLPESCEEPVNVPAPCEEPESAPASCEEPDSLPESCEESESLPESCEEPVNVPASCEEPESAPASCEEPDSLPESCEESESLPESCEEPEIVPVSCEEPEIVPASCEEPEYTYEEILSYLLELQESKTEIISVVAGSLISVVDHTDFSVINSGHISLVISNVLNKIEPIIGSICLSVSPLISRLLLSIEKLKNSYDCENIDSIDITVSDIASALSSLIATVSSITQSATENITLADSVLEGVLSLSVVLSVVTCYVQSALSFVVSYLTKNGAISLIITQVTKTISIQIKSVISIVVDISESVKYTGCVLRVIISKITVTLTTITKTIYIALSSVIGFASNLSINGSFSTAVSNTVQTLTSSATSTVTTLATASLDAAFTIINRGLLNFKSIRGISGVNLIILKIKNLLNVLIKSVGQINQTVCSNAGAVDSIVSTLNDSLDELGDCIKTLVDSVAGVTKDSNISDDFLAYIAAVVASAANVSTFITGVLESLSSSTTSIETTIQTAINELVLSINGVISTCKSVKSITPKIGGFQSSHRGGISTFHSTLGTLSKSLSSIGKSSATKYAKGGTNFSGLINNIKQAQNINRKLTGSGSIGSATGIRNASNASSKITSSVNLTSSLNKILQSFGNVGGKNLKFNIRNNGCKICNRS